MVVQRVPGPADIRRDPTVFNIANHCRFGRGDTVILCCVAEGLPVPDEGRLVSMEVGKRLVDLPNRELSPSCRLCHKDGRLWARPVVYTCSVVWVALKLK